MLSREVDLLWAVCWARLPSSLVVKIKKILLKVWRLSVASSRLIEVCNSGTRRARKILYWPRMSAEIKDFISRCSICQAHRPTQAQEEMQPHELATRPWQKIEADLFELGPRAL